MDIFIVFSDTWNFLLPYTTCDHLASSAERQINKAYSNKGFLFHYF